MSCLFFKANDFNSWTAWSSYSPCDSRFYKKLKMLHADKDFVMEGPQALLDGNQMDMELKQYM